MNKKEIFKDFLKKYNLFIDYNGEHYTLTNNKNDVIMVFDTSNEIFYYIHGYNTSTRENELMVKELEDRNDINIERYEEMLKGLEENEKNA